MQDKNTLKKLNSLVVWLVFIVLGVSVYLAFSGRWIAADINRWQMRLQNGSTYYPALTAFLLAIPALLVLLPVKMMLNKKLKQ